MRIFSYLRKGVSFNWNGCPLTEPVENKQHMRPFGGPCKRKVVLIAACQWTGDNGPGSCYGIAAPTNTPNDGVYSLLHTHPAVYLDYLPGNVAGIFRDQVGDKPGHFFLLTESLERNHR